MEEKINEFIASDKIWIGELIEKYPQQIPIAPIAQHWGCAPDTVRAMIEQSPTFGLYWRKAGKTNKAYLIPTGLFVRWYCKVVF